MISITTATTTTTTATITPFDDCLGGEGGRMARAAKTRKENPFDGFPSGIIRHTRHSADSIRVAPEKVLLAWKRQMQKLRGKDIEILAGEIPYG